MRKVYYICWCFLNFLPLWVVLIVRDAISIQKDTVNLGAEWCGIIGCLCGLVISLLVVWLGLREVVASHGESGELVSATEKKTLTADVLLSYVLPLLAFDFGRWIELLEFLVFFMLIVFLSMRHNVLGGNIFLELLGYRFYSCRIKIKRIDGSVKPEDYHLLARRSLAGEIGKAIYVVNLDTDLMIEKKGNENGK